TEWSGASECIRPSRLCRSAQRHRIRAMMLLALAAVLVALFAWRTAWSAHVERSVGARLSAGPDGTVRGAEPIDLEPPSPIGAVLLLHGFGDSPQSLVSLAHALYERGFIVSVPLLPGH